MLSCKVDNYTINLKITGKVSIKFIKSCIGKIVSDKIENYVCYYRDMIMPEDTIISIDEFGSDCIMFIDYDELKTQLQNSNYLMTQELKTKRKMWKRSYYTENKYSIKTHDDKLNKNNIHNTIIPTERKMGVEPLVMDFE